MTAEGGGALRASVVREYPFLSPPVRRTSVYSAGDVLPNDCFVHLIRTERKRADRSRAPLSLAVFKCSHRGSDGPMRLEQLIQTIYELKRETDIVGYLEHDSIGVLLVDTANDGALTFQHRVLSRCGHRMYVGTIYTHPDLLFECLQSEEGAALCSRAVIFDALPRHRRVEAAVKRALDVILALLCMAVFAPIMGICALAIAVTSPGPMIFRQERLGRGGVPFVINKFRSMHHRADDGIHREHVKRLIGQAGKRLHAATKSASWSPLEQDPRITPIGRVMRRLKFDELPQLVNVVKGDLSLVGPRPPIEYEVKQYQAWHLRRILYVRPGITGIWQVEGGDSTSFDDMVRMDLRYVESWSLLSDLKILVKTAGVVLRSIVEPLAGASFRRLPVPARVRLTPRWRRRNEP